MKKNSLLFAILIAISGSAYLHAQPEKQMTSADIWQQIKKLRKVGTVMYMAAHPDDENTRVISYFANAENLDVTYLSLTRGDGGQNLIGTETGEALGLLRTQELLAARRIDGGKQLFTRANDFGFSKNSAETFTIWDRNKILGDVVWAIRKIQPDIIINRFTSDSEGKTHGHHTASAILSEQAYEMAGDPNAFPEQLKYVKTWKPRRVYFNASWFFYGSKEKFAQVDKSNMDSLDMGIYIPSKGKSNSEIAALSRSQHRCQGFGSALTRGSDYEYFVLVKGQKSADGLLGGLDQSWNRLENGGEVEKMLAQIEQNFDFTRPYLSIPALLTARASIAKLGESGYRNQKLKDIDNIIKNCAGLYLEASTKESVYTPGGVIDLQLEATLRSDFPARLLKVSLPECGIDTTFNVTTGNNQNKTYSWKTNLPSTLTYSSPYWLEKEHPIGMYEVDDLLKVGIPENGAALHAVFSFEFNKDILQFPVNIIFKKTDPSIGEIYKNVTIMPPVVSEISEKIDLFNTAKTRKIHIKISSNTDKIKGTLKPEIPVGWTIQPTEASFSIDKKGDNTSLTFDITPAANAQNGYLTANCLIDGKVYAFESQNIRYEHIPDQVILKKSRAKLIKADLKIEGKSIAYIMGAGDEIPTVLEQLGYNVTLLKDSEIELSTLKKYNTVITGIRAYNTREILKYKQPVLMDFVKNGGTLLVQYNTTGETFSEDLGPYPFKLSRDRVTREDAEMRLLDPKNVNLTYPNQLSGKDFDGWIQERGLYFPGEIDQKYTKLFSCNDPDESPKDGSTIVAIYGKGKYVYTGLSFFRQLPIGHVGATRLFANLIAPPKP